jgi:23S rRNA pseudouridine2605 synthase
MAKQNFEKFINKEVKGAKKKEQIKQEKKKVKKEREAYFIEKKREQRAIKKIQGEEERKTAYNRRKGTDKTGQTTGLKKTLPLKRKAYPAASENTSKTFSGKRPEKKTGKPTFEKRSTPASSPGNTKPFRSEKNVDKGSAKQLKHPYKKSFDKDFSPEKNLAQISKKSDLADNSTRVKPALKKTTNSEALQEAKPKRSVKQPEAIIDNQRIKPVFKKNIETPNQEEKAPIATKQVKVTADKTGKKAQDEELTRGNERPLRTRKKIEPGEKENTQKPFAKPTKPVAKNRSFDKPADALVNKPVPAKNIEKPAKPIAPKQDEAEMPLNKYIAHAGICSRRDAGGLVKQGKVAVNGVVVTDPGTKVTLEDKITLDGKKLAPQNTLVYILLNKPKDYITTAEDPQGRKTVLDIVRSATTERIFPVGRLDRNTSGVLLLTNDGDLAQQLTHPSYEVRKIYEAKLDKPLTKADFTRLADGVTLEDGFVKADSVAYADSKDKSIIGIEIHSGRNRVVRRMFEHLGYDVRGLDRVMFANLTKKNVDRGKWRFLTEKEVRLLKYFKSAN